MAPALIRLYLLCVLISGTALAEVNGVRHSYLNIDEIPQAVANTELSRSSIPSPHWKDGACNVCHLKTPATEKNLRRKDIREICQTCHDARYDHRYIHPVNVKPSAEMLKRMNRSYKESLKKSSGKLSCTTCHDISIQCKASKSNQKLVNKKFFRQGPFETRSQPCYFCHDEKQYQRLNPHEQLDDNGKIISQKCRICHAGSIDDLVEEKSIKDVEFHAPDDNLVSMCWGCHKWTPHPGGQFSFFKDKSGPNHLIKPTDYVFKTLTSAEEKNNIIFPLEPKTGKIFCATCHNPHQKGVIGNAAAAKGADSKRRLRAPQVCKYCHLK